MATLGYKPPQTTARTSVSFDALQEASRSAASVRRRRLVEIFVCEVVAAFKILTADDKVKALLVNIFGGIMKCDVIASGIVSAAKQVGIKVPLIVRLEGTNVEAGKEILANSGMDIIAADDLDDAAKKAVAALA